MKQFIRDFMSNDSTFGKIMTRLAIIIGANLMFLVFSMPVVTIGPGLAALYYVMLKTLHRDDSLNPFKTFWKGFVMNLKQGLLAMAIFAGAAAVLVLDIRFCNYAGGIFTYFKYACYAILFFLVIEFIYLMPVMAAFQDTLPHLMRNAFFFAARKPWKIILAAAFNIVPIGATVLDERNRPLYGFLWVILGFGMITMLVSELLYNDIKEYLPEEEDEEGGAAPKKVSERKTLREMKKLEK